LPSLFEACRRLSTSATTYYDVRATKPELFSPRRDGDRDLLPFLTCHAFSLCGSGDTRRAARRPEAVTPVLVPLGCPSLPNRDASAAAPPPRLAPAEHSEDRRARVEGPSEGRVPVRLQRCLVPAAGACASMRMPTAFPSSAPFGHPLSSARHLRGRKPAQATDRPRPPFRRRPAKSDAFQKTGMPFTATPREGVDSRKDCSLRPSRRLSRSRRPHAVLWLGIRCFCWALQGHGAVTRGSVSFESADVFFTCWNLRAWD
jgi:hypothetical protein